MKAGFSPPAWRMAKIAAQRAYSRWNTHRKKRTIYAKLAFNLSQCQSYRQKYDILYTFNAIL